MGSRLKINFDAAFNNHKKELCFGLVIRNEEARVICSKTVMNTNILFVFAAEAVACVQALNLGLQLGLREVETEGDSWSVVRKLQEKMNDRSEANKVAHLLASEGIKKGESTYLSSLVPSGVAEVVAEDRRWMDEARESRERGNEEMQGAAVVHSVTLVGGTCGSCRCNVHGVNEMNKNKWSELTEIWRKHWWCLFGQSRGQTRRDTSSGPTLLWRSS
ncbi:hypothetical protein PVK06_038797 [Gossypium arboreum]|uniref:RNase H type-1 domain-containing protein n=1 Tax=Gossypium arboreum TaxID=29729 RepID=A0ABR0N3R3_GOSAR|nr:hypothetical protein PVK06_038797 [Gossypium arboreum]